MIPFSKTSNGNAQVLLVKDDRMWRLTSALKREQGSTAPLWAGSLGMFRATLGSFA